jgi:hypothetical protein
MQHTISELDYNDPDYLIEEFWLGFKNSLTNFYKIYPVLTRPVDQWSTILNKYKDKMAYKKIQKKVYDYIMMHIIDTMRSYDSYHSNILNTNLKRWIKICNKVSFYTFHEELNHNYQLYRIYINIVNGEKKEDCKHIFLQPELILFHNDFNSLIVFAVENNKGSILDRLQNIYDISEDIEFLYPVEIRFKMKGDKIIKMIKF